MAKDDREGGEPLLTCTVVTTDATGGFAGVHVVKSIPPVEAESTLIDRQNHHLFQPLLYQVATAALSAVDIAQPIRAILATGRIFPW